MTEVVIIELDDEDEGQEETPRCPKCGKTETMFNNCGSGALLCEDCDPPCPCCYDVDDELDEEEDEEE